MAFDFSAVVTPFRMQPGMRRLGPGAPHLTPNRPDDASLRAKLAVLTLHAADALLAAPDFDAAPALDAIARRAATEHPHAFVREGAAAFFAPWLGVALHDGRVTHAPPEIGACLQALPETWRLAGLLSLAFAEDYAVLDGDDARVPWLAVCLPSNWVPRDKVGRAFTQIHATVADNGSLIAAADHLVRLVAGGERWERFVWTFTDDARLARHPQRPAAPRWNAGLDVDALAAASFFRTERQTFFPVAGTRQAVFTIHVDVQPMTAAVTSAADAASLHAALSSMSPAVLAYRGLDSARDRLLAWLARRAAAPPLG